MRVAIALTLILILAAPVMAQKEETLLGEKIEHGGFGGPVIKFTEMKDKFAVLVGGRGGWIINHAFSIGGAGFGLVNQDIDEREISPDTTVFMTMGYGGLELEYTANSSKLVHMTVSSLIGVGGIDYVIKDRLDGGSDQTYDVFDGDFFFVFEPAINGEVNMVSFFRINAGVSYRYINGIETEGIGDSDLAGLAAQITLKFGKF